MTEKIIFKPKKSAQRFYSVAKLSENISETPEGFLICANVPITRSGDLIYAQGETPVQSENGKTIISRTIEDIHDPVTIASFEGKPITIEHPDDFVNPENWKSLAVGIVQNVRPGEGEDENKLLADLLINDKEAIFSIKNKDLREVSCGYEAEYIEDSPGKGRQINIVGNHVALVRSGRCGPDCAVQDSAPKKGKKLMKVKEKVLSLFGKALDEAMIEEPPMDSKDVDPLMAIMAKLEAIEAKLNKEHLPVADIDVPSIAESESSIVDEAGAVEKRLAVIEAALAKLLGMEEKEKIDEVSQDTCATSDTFSRAEILAPGIAKTGDVKSKALEIAYKTEDGKKAIDLVLNGKEMKTVDTNLLFIAASEILKNERREKIISSTAADSFSSFAQGPVTAEKLNQINAVKFGKIKG